MLSNLARVLVCGRRLPTYTTGVHYSSASSSSNTGALNQQLYNKLMYRSKQRGTRENSVLIGAYATAKLKDMSEQQIKEYEQILDEQDPDLYKWITGKEPFPEDLAKNSVANDLKSFVKKHGHLDVELYR